MNHLEFPETGFLGLPEREGKRGGGVVSRMHPPEVFPFLETESSSDIAFSRDVPRSSANAAFVQYQREDGGVAP